VANVRGAKRRGLEFWQAAVARVKAGEHLGDGDSNAVPFPEPQPPAGEQRACTMTLPTVSNQGFTVHNHICGINFLSHRRGAPQKPTPNWDEWDHMG